MEDLSKKRGVVKKFDEYLRRHFHRLLGAGEGPGGLPLNLYNITKAFFLYERQVEVAAGPINKRWRIGVILRGGKREFAARLTGIKGWNETGFFAESAEVKRAVGYFQGQSFTVENVETDSVKFAAPGPFTLIELFEEGLARRLCPVEDLKAALDKLRDRVEVQGRSLKLVSSVDELDEQGRLELIRKMRGAAAEEFPGVELPGRLEQGLSGEMMVPLDPKMAGDSLLEGVSGLEFDLYGIIRRRALSAFLGPAVFEEIRVRMGAGDCRFIASERLVDLDGYLGGYRACRDPERVNPVGMARLERGEELRLVKIVPDREGGELPEYYRLEELYDDLADFDPGSDDGRTLSLGQFLGCDYIRIDDRGYLHGQKNLAALVRSLSRAFPTMVGIQFSSYVQQTVVEALTGRKSLEAALRQFDQTLNMRGKVQVRTRSSAVISSGKIIKPKKNKTAQAADVGGSAVSEAASGVEEGETDSVRAEEESGSERAVTEPAVEDDRQDVVDGFLEPVEGDAPVEEVEEAGYMMEAGAQGDSGPPAGREETVVELSDQAAGSAAGPLPVDPDAPARSREDVGIMDCPLCLEGRIAGRLTRANKLFYICSGKDCEFMAWSRPYPVACERCRSPFMVEGRGGVLRCPRSDCRFEIPPAEAGRESGELVRKRMVRRVSGRKGVSGRKRMVRVVRRK